MGCAASKEIGVAKTPSSKNKLSVQGVFKRVFLDGVLLKEDQRRKQVNESQLLEIAGPAPEAPEAPEQNVNTLGEILQKQEEITQQQLEVINVWELMEGLEDDEQEQFLARVEGEDQGSSSLSSPDSALRSFSVNGSPTSPLCFESPVRNCKRYRNSKEMDIVVTRNFSFNLRSCVDHQLAATPKVILDSTSPLLIKQQQQPPPQLQDFKQRLNIMQQDSDDATLASCCFDFPRGSADGEADKLLSSFESMMEQIARDARTTTTEVTLYFTTEDQECGIVVSILRNYGVEVKKKDISADPTCLTGLIDHYVQVPALFINGRYIGGAQQLHELREKDQLKLLLEGSVRVCNGCCGINFVPCLDCNGSRRFMSENGELEHCTECTEDGMVNCPLCS